MAQSISRIINYIKSSLADKKSPAKNFEQVTKGFWSLIIAIYFSRWDLLPVEDGKTFRDLVGERILNSYVSRTKEVDLVFFLFSSLIFIFILIYFPLFYF